MLPVTFTLTADADYDRHFNQDPITISGTTTVSESNTLTQATHQFSEVLGSSGGTTSTNSRKLQHHLLK